MFVGKSSPSKQFSSQVFWYSSFYLCIYLFHINMFIQHVFHTHILLPLLGGPYFRFFISLSYISLYDALWSCIYITWYFNRSSISFLTHLPSWISYYVLILSILVSTNVLSLTDAANSSFNDLIHTMNPSSFYFSVSTFFRQKLLVFRTQVHSHSP